MHFSRPIFLSVATRSILFLALASGSARAASAPLTIDYPLNLSVFPPDIVAPTFQWRDSSPVSKLWRVEIDFSDGQPPLRALTRGERPRLGEIDPRCISKNNQLPTLTAQEADSHTWTPDPLTWAAIKKRSPERPARVTISGFPSELAKEPASSGAVTILTSKDPVAAPIFYRDVPLMPSTTEKGVIKPLDQTLLPLINWRLKSISRPGSRVLITGMYTCANCHSFSRDGKTMGMDLDGPGNDKGMYTMLPIKQQMSIGASDVIEWRSSQGKMTGQIRVGFMSQVSPDGQYVVNMIAGPGPQGKGTLNNFYTANFTDYRFLQVFYPTRGILAWYSRQTGKLQPLPGADDPRYVHTNAVWSPDGKYVVFARAEARDAYPEGSKLAERANDPNETQIQYDLYRIPFNGGQGGTPERILGASENGMSNSFPKVSPDGRWIVYVQARNGELMRPDSQLYIIPFQGGQARRLQANTPLMNSWHSFSPNGRWLVFSSKSRGPYTKLFLTHLDAEGNASPAILIDNTTAANRASNIPEFVNIPADGIMKIDVPATELYRRFNLAWEHASKGHLEEALTEWKKALVASPGNAQVLLNIGVTLSRANRPAEALAYYEHAVKQDPDSAEIRTNYGLGLTAAGKPEQALEQYRKALEVKPEGRTEISDATAHDLIGRALLLTGDLSAALPEFDQATRLRPDFEPHLYDYALALAQLNRTEEALAKAATAVQLEPKHVEAHLLLGDLLAGRHQLAGAAAEYQQAIALRPNSGRAQFSLAVVLADQDNLQGAIDHLRAATMGDDPTAAAQAAQALKRVGQ